MAVDGDHLQLVSDRGQWVRFRPVIQGGLLRGAEEAASAPILNDAGAPVTKGGQDAEDIAPGGWVSFEGDHRIDRFRCARWTGGGNLAASRLVKTPLQWRA